MARALDPLEPNLIIHGGATGADEMANLYAGRRGIQRIIFPANWSIGKKAGPIRNQLMLDVGKPNLVVAFPGGTGTADMVRRSRKAGVEVIEISAAD